MGIERYWRVLTTGERLIVFATAGLLAVLVIVGGVLLGGAPFLQSQTTPAGGTIVDSDGDGLSDDHEDLRFGTDPQHGDTDRDGLPDGWEAEHAKVDPATGLITPDPTRNDRDADPDQDELPHIDEFRNGTNPWSADTDGDGLTDGWEIRSGHDPLDAATPTLDLDGDGLTAREEFEAGTLDNAVDSDNDGLTDVEELQGSATIGATSYSFEPTDPAVSSTGGSGLPDGFAVVYDLDPHDPNVGRRDADGDGLSSALEARYSIENAVSARDALTLGLDPTNPDTDGDGLPDGWEITHGLDPLDPADGAGDPDEDGLGNGDELFWGTDPLSADTDDDGLTDGEEVSGWTIFLNGRDVRVSSNPLLADSDNDGLTDLEEHLGEIEEEGETTAFPRTHPLLPDSDGDRLQDGFEIRTDFAGMRLNATAADSDTDGIQDADELDYWTQRQDAAATSWPASLEPPEAGECQEEATAGIQAQDPAVLGPAGDPDGDCLPNILDPDSDRRAEESLPQSTSPLLDGQELEPGRSADGRSKPATDPALPDTDGDGLPDEWELRWTRVPSTNTGSLQWALDPTNPDSDGDGTPDGEDDEETNCWGDRLRDADDDAEAPGDSIPWRPNQPFTNADEMTANTDPFDCDTDDDDLVDGWEHAYRAHAELDPRTPLTEPWRGTVIQTVCYPGSRSDPPLPAVDEMPNVVPFPDASVPPSGAVGEAPAAMGLWSLNTGGCSWGGESARAGTQCNFCNIVGISMDLRWAQAAKTNPNLDDTDNDGGPDAWETLWLAISGNTTTAVRPGVHDDGTGDLDEADMGFEFQAGSSPLVRDTDGDQERDDIDPDPLSRAEGAVLIRDEDGDHLLDSSRCTGGTFSPNEQERRDAAIALRLLQPADNVFLCEPGTADPDGETRDADQDGIPDAWELLHSYRDQPTNPNLGTFSPTSDFDGDGVRDRIEATLGRPAGWPSDVVWWFGSDPLAPSGLDADGDGLSEALGLDPDPFGNLGGNPDPGQAWTLAVEQGIVHPPGTPITWSGGSSQTSFSVNIESLGHPAPGQETPTVWKGDTLPLSVQVTRNGNPVSNLPVAIFGMTASEASRLVGDGELTLLSDQSRVACMLITGSDGRVPADGCVLESGGATTDLRPTGRTWFGEQQPSWTRNLTVLDPLVSSTATPENNPAIVVWAMGQDDDVGATARRQVLVKANTTIQVEGAPESASSGETISVPLRVLDKAGDPVTEGELTVETSEGSSTERLSPAGTARSEVTLPRVDEATTARVELTYRAPSGDRARLFSSQATHAIKVLPVPTLSVTEKAENITAGSRTEVSFRLAGPGGQGIQGPVEVQFASLTVNATTGPDGRATVTLDIPRDIDPGTKPLTANFPGSDAYGPASESEEVTVRQVLDIEVTPKSALLGQPTRFTFTFTDLAGNAPIDAINATINLGGVTDAIELEGGDEIVSVLLPVSGAIGESVIEISTPGPPATPLYEAQRKTVPLTVQSEGVLQVQPTRVPRGATTELELSLTDALDRPVPSAEVVLATVGRELTATIEDGEATVPLSIPRTQDAGELTLTYEATGPGLLGTQGSLNLIVQTTTNLTAVGTTDPASGLVALELSLQDDAGDPLANAPVEINWPLGENQTVRTDAEGNTRATLQIPDDAEPGEVAIQARYEGSREHTPADAFLTVPIRSPTRIEMNDDLVWVRGQALSLSGRVVALESNRSVALPVEVRHGEEVVANAPARAPFDARLSSEVVANLAQGSQRFALEVSMPGDDSWAPASTTVLVRPLLPVELSIGIDRTADGVTLTVEATTPDGPFTGAQIAVATTAGPGVTKTTDDQGRAIIQLQGHPAELVASYRGDDAHAPAEARVNLAETAAQPTSEIAWLLIAAAVLLVAADLWVLYRVSQRLRVGRQVEQVLADLEDELMLGDEVQAAIYRAYLRLRALAEVLGEPEEETETVREFGQRFVAGLSLDEAPVMGLITVFERAWYNQVTPSMRSEAITELRRIRDHLEQKGLIA